MEEKGNILASCPLRDHFRTAHDTLEHSKARFSNPEAEYGDNTRKYFDPVWKDL